MSPLEPSDEVREHTEALEGEGPERAYLEHLLDDITAATEEALEWPEPHRKVLAAHYATQRRRLLGEL
jgi:hypothetical protein